MAGARRSVLRSPWIWAFLAGIGLLTAIRPLLRFEPAPPPTLGAVPAFQLLDQDGRPFGSPDLAGQPYIASFFFTRCRSICPALVHSLQLLQARMEREGVEGIRIVTFSVDPDYDTPERLREYSASAGADPRRWVFLTGPRQAMEELLLQGFKVPLGRPEEIAPGLMDIAHTGKLVLVDGRGGIRGYYSADGEGLDEIFHRAQHVRGAR